MPPHLIDRLRHCLTDADAMLDEPDQHADQ
jgi:hypothetical protein